MYRLIRKLLARNKPTTCVDAGRKGWKARDEKEKAAYVATAAKLARYIKRPDLADKLERVRMNPTQEDIERAKTPRGGWDKQTLARWGVPWPPPKGWRKALTTDKLEGTRDE